MDEATKEILLDLIFNESDKVRIPTPVAWDEEAVDWLFYLLHSRDYGLSTTVDFLGKHFPADPRFLLWKYRAFIPNYGHKGADAEQAYRFIEKHEPSHPWLIPLMEQSVCCNAWSSDGFCFGRDFRSYLASRFEQMLGDHDPSSGVPQLLPEHRRLPRECVESVYRSDDDDYHGATLVGTLAALGSTIPADVAAALETAAIHLYQAEEITARLIAMARDGDKKALLWIARRYPENPAALEVLEQAAAVAIDERLTDVMCFQGICLPQLRNRFLKSVENPTLHYNQDCHGLLAVRAEREMLRDKVLELWEHRGLRLSTISRVYLLGFPMEPVIPRILGMTASGDLLDDHARWNLLPVVIHADISEALTQGIRAAVDRFDLVSPVLLLGMIYGDRPETVALFKELVRNEPMVSKSGAEAAFTEVLRLGGRGPEDLQWALDALRNSRQRTGSIADRCPALLLHFFGTGPEVVGALQDFALAPHHPVLANASLWLLLNKLPAALPVDRRSAVEGLSFGERGNYLRMLCHRLGENEENLSEILHFILHDPDLAIRKTVLESLWNAVECNSVPSGSSDQQFAQACLQREELAQIAAKLLVKWSPG